MALVDEVLRYVPAEVVVGSVACLAILVLWLVPKWQTARYRTRGHLTAQDLFGMENEARKTLSQLLGGIVLLIGLAFTWRQIGGTEEGRITDRYTDAVNQLGVTSPEVRLGGIYALERIGRDSAKDAGPIREVLAAFVRMHACWDERSEEPVCSAATPTSTSDVLSEEVRAVITVIASLDAFDTERTRCLDLSHTNLGEVDLRNATLRDICFADASLVGAKFNRATLIGVNFRDADLSRAALSDATIDGAIFDFATMENTKLYRTTVRNPIGLTEEQIAVACLDSQTVLPDDVATPVANQALLCA
jgi:hypothetical protein